MKPNPVLWTTLLVAAMGTISPLLTASEVLCFSFGTPTSITHALFDLWKP